MDSLRAIFHRIVNVENEEIPNSLTLMLKALVLYLNSNFFFSGFGKHNVSFSQSLDRFLLENHIVIPDLWAVASWRMLFVICSCFVLLNIQIRKAAFGIGALIFTGLFLNQASYSNNTFFAGCLFFVTSISSKQSGYNFIMIQLAIMYFGAAIDKALAPTWQDGSFFLLWKEKSIMLTIPGNIIGMKPAALIWSYSTIILEFALALGILFKKTRLITLHIAIIFHLSTVFFDNTFFGCFVICILISFYSFVQFDPQITITVSGNFFRFWQLVSSVIIPQASVIQNPTPSGSILIGLASSNLTGYSAVQYIILRSSFVILIASSLFLHHLLPPRMLFFLALSMYAFFFPWARIGNLLRL